MLEGAKPTTAQTSRLSLEERLTGRHPTSNIQHPTSRFAEIAVNSGFPHRQTFSYSVPDDLDLRAGRAVYVPFGRLMLQGIVLEVHGTPMFSEPEKIRPVRSIIG